MALDIRMLALAIMAGSVMGLPVDANAAPRQAEQACPSQVSGLTQAQANDILQRLKNAQEGLRRGDRLTFDLLTGAGSGVEASAQAATTSPRDAFLGLSFDRPFVVRPSRSRNGTWVEYEIELWPGCTDALLWGVTVAFDMDGTTLRRIEALYRRVHTF